MINCKAQLDFLGEIVDGTAPLSRRMSFQFHLLLCYKCRIYFKQFKAMKEAAQEVEEADLPDDFFDVMEAAIQRAENQPPKPTNT